MDAKKMTGANGKPNCCPCPPRPVDPTARFAAALAALTRCYEEVKEKVDGYDEDIAANKAAIEKEVADRIAADEELRAALVAIVDAKLASEAAARENRDNELQKEIDDLAGSEIGGLAERLAAEIRNRIAADEAEAKARGDSDSVLSERIDNEITVRTQQHADFEYRVSLVEKMVKELPSFYTRVDNVEDHLEDVDSSLKGEIITRGAEVARLQEADRLLDGRLTEVEKFGGDLDEERQARIAGDEACLNRITSTKEELEDRIRTTCRDVSDRAAAALAGEVALRKDADNAIRGELSEAIETERNGRTNGDKALAEQIGSVKTQFALDLKKEKEARVSGDNDLKDRIESLGNKEENDIRDITNSVKRTYATKEALAAETESRRNRDQELTLIVTANGAAIQKETEDRAHSYTAINNHIGTVENDLIEKVAKEKSKREAEVARLDKRIDDIESGGISERLEKEIADRKAADEAEKEERLAHEEVARGALTEVEHRLNDEVATRTSDVEALWRAIEGGGGGGSGTGDATSFYVWANDITVPAGKISEMPESIRSTLEGVYGTRVTKDDINIAQPIEPGFVHKIVFRSICHVTSALDISVEWGDGTKTRVASANDDELSVKRITNSYGVYESQYTLTHEYKTPGKFLVTITGRDYFNTQNVEGSNLICDVFNNKAHVASFIKNLASTYANSNRLLFVDAAYVYPLREKSNLSQLFAKCHNLYEVISCSHPTASSYTGGVFLDCRNLVLHDSPSVGTLEHDDTLSNCFSGCVSLEMDVADVFKQKITATKVAIGGMFLNCSKLYGKVPSQFLWEDATVEWSMGLSPDGDGSNRSGPFYGCSDEIREQVPLSWGGTNADIVIRPHDDVRVTKTDLSLSEATSAIKLAAVSSEVKSLIAGLTARVKTLEESGSGGKPIEVLTMVCADDGNDYDIKAVNDDDDPTLEISASTEKKPGIQEVIYFYGNDGKKYAVRVVLEDGDPTIDVSRVYDIGDSDITTGIKFDCKDDGAVYVLKVVKPIDDAAVISLVPFGA